MKTASNPTIHAIEYTSTSVTPEYLGKPVASSSPTGPIDRYRARSHQYVTGLWAAIGCKTSDMLPTGTNAALMNTIGKISVKIAACTASTCLIARPIVAEIHENVNPTATTRTTTPRVWISPPSNRKPTM